MDSRDQTFSRMCIIHARYAYGKYSCENKRHAKSVMVRTFTQCNLFLYVRCII